MEEIRKKIKETYAMFLYKYKKRMLNISKKAVDQLHEATLKKLKQEENEYRAKKYKYAMYPTDQMRRERFFGETKAICDNFTRQMRKYVDEKYIQVALEAEEFENTPLLLRESNKTHLIVDDPALGAELDAAARK